MNPTTEWCQPYDEAAMIQESSDALTSRPIVDAKVVIVVMKIKPRDP